MPVRITLPLTQKDISALRAGDEVALFGVAYTARDAAHKKLTALLEAGENLPFSMEGACIYYAGPCPGAPGEVIGPCGPTTSGRMDGYTPMLIAHGLNAMVGKGMRSPEVKAAMAQKAVYFTVTGGAAMLIAQHIVSSEMVAFPELGAEAVRRITFDALPAIVAVDANGGDLFLRS